MIALTDGNDTKSQVPPIEAARVAAQRDITIYTVAIGDPTTVGEDKLDEKALKEVASTANGSYFFAADRKQLEGIYDKLDQIETREVKTVSHRPRRDLFCYFLLAAVLLSILRHSMIVLRHRRERPTDKRQPNVRVNPVNGQLEVVA
jgi:Ca-activated chloride channel family protein